MLFLLNNEKWTGSGIVVEGANAISESLKINTTLTQLNLDCNWNTTIEKSERIVKKLLFVNNNINEQVTKL